MPFGLSTSVTAKQDLTSLQPPQLHRSTTSALNSQPNQHHHPHLPAPQQVSHYLPPTTATTLSPRTKFARTTTRPHLSAAILKQRNHIAATASRYSARARMIARRRATTVGEYRNLRQSIPALRRQRDIGKVEVVTEAARYIDHLHRTLIERFMLCGIPDSLKDLLGTTDARELSPQHIMNLVTKMAAKQPASSAQQQLMQAPTTLPQSIASSTRPPLSGAAATRLNPSQVALLPAQSAPVSGSASARQDVLKTTDLWLSKA